MLARRACVRFTNSKENWPIHNTFRSHLLVYFGEFLHTIYATDVLKMMMWLFENWNFRALSLSLSFVCCSLVEHCFCLQFTCIWKSFGFSCGLHATIGNKYHWAISLIWEYVGSDSHTRCPQLEIKQNDHFLLLHSLCFYSGMWHR